MSESRDFDPMRYLTKVNGRDYLTVQWRLVWLRAVHPLAQIETELVKVANGGAIFRATITLPPDHVRLVSQEDGTIEARAWSASATGYGSETAEDFPDYLEKAETKAIGRALAALGFGTQFAQEFGEPIVDAPAARPARPAPQRQSQRQSQPAPPARSDTVSPLGSAPSDRQLKYARALMRENHWPDAAFREHLIATYNADALEALDRRAVSHLIEELNARGPYVDPRQRQLPVGDTSDSEPEYMADDPWSEDFGH